jgi:hypothetical protein
VSPVKYRLCLYIPEDGVLHSDPSENLISYTELYNFNNIDNDNSNTNLTFIVRVNV